MEILVPVPVERDEQRVATTRPKSLAGATVALVDDFYDAIFTEALEAELAATYGAVVRRLVKPWGSAPSPRTLIDEAATCQVAVVGIAL